MTEQLSLFSRTDTLQLSRQPCDRLIEMSPKALAAWKQTIFEYQHQVRMAPSLQQGNLFEGSSLLPCDPVDVPDPFTLERKTIEFWRWKSEDTENYAALYFVFDAVVPLLLYIGESLKFGQRWRGEHDCKQYKDRYIIAHRQQNLPVAIQIGIWPGAPSHRRKRQALESQLIHQWRSPFNKENWSTWHTPFTAG